ncbi:MAG TPA: ribonuclease HI family protein [Firmicutes bacterium]|jgi:ribonuclease HI|nr:ribonuclease HI family protein [Bacillota bacterium]
MRELVLNTDGAARHNPGPAALGVVIAENGQVIKTISEYVGETTNNVAEYLAVIRGLEEAMSLGAERVQIRSDSELLVKQINGQYKVKNEGLRPLYLLVKVLMEKFTEVSFLHINREQNKEADWLANKALDAKN